MENEIRRIALEDGCVFEVQTVRLPGWSFSSTAVVVNDAMRDAAESLLPSAIALAKSRAARLAFFRASRQSLDVENGRPYAKAEDALKEANDRAAALLLLSSGLAADGKRTVSVGDWLEILQFFNQDSRIGCVEQRQE